MNDSPSNALEVTVTELSSKLKRTVEDTFGHVRVRGEISGYRGPHSSGHSYFSLKDDRARLEAVIWRGQASKLKHLPEEGLEVIATGKLTTYPGSSKYQIVIDNLEPAGAGALMALLEERRKKLTAEGLFEDGRKQLLPYMPRVIGVITSPTGAVIRDILHRIADRFPIHVIVWPVRVQGDTCGPEVANGVKQFNALPDSGPLPKPDLLIVARGGGSLEDLWGFNDEIAVRAVADSLIPVISAVGHETDWTLIDHAADWRAPTPTAAAERAVPVRAELEALVADYGARLRGAMSRLMEKKRSDIKSLGRALPTPDLLLSMPRRRFDEASGRLGRALETRVTLARNRYVNAGNRLGPHTLARKVDAGRERLNALEDRRSRAISLLLVRRKERLLGLSGQVRLGPLESRIGRDKNSLARLSQQLQLRSSTLIAGRKERFTRADRLLESLSYKNVLSRGYAVIRDVKAKPLTKVGGVRSGSELSVEMQDGILQVVAGASAGVTAPKKPTKSVKTENQGDLF